MAFQGVCGVDLVVSTGLLSLTVSGKKEHKAAASAYWLQAVKWFGT